MKVSEFLSAINPKSKAPHSLYILSKSSRMPCSLDARTDVSSMTSILSNKFSPIMSLNVNPSLLGLISMPIVLDSCSKCRDSIAFEVRLVANGMYCSNSLISFKKLSMCAISRSVSG